MYIGVGHVNLTHWTKKWICTKRALWCKNWKCKLRRKSGANTPHLPPNFHWAVSKLDRIYFKTTVSIFCLCFYVTPLQIQVCPTLYIKLCCLILFSEISIYIIFWPWSEVCVILAFPPYPFVFFLIPSYLLRTPDNSNFLDFLRRFELWREDYCSCTFCIIFSCPEKIWCKSSFSLIHSTNN